MTPTTDRIAFIQKRMAGTSQEELLQASFIKNHLAYSAKVEAVQATAQAQLEEVQKVMKEQREKVKNNASKVSNHQLEVSLQAHKNVHHELIANVESAKEMLLNQANLSQKLKEQLTQLIALQKLPSNSQVEKALVAIGQNVCTEAGRI